MLELSAGLTTGHAPLVEQARSHGDLYIHQPYELYTQANHDVWQRLHSRIEPLWSRFANPTFLDGVDALHLPSDRIPHLADINSRLAPLTGFQARPVSGYVPSFVFFDCLRRREFPTTITIRPADRMDYLAEPDIFHDIAGHVPMHTSRTFADTLVRFGEFARTAADLTSSIRDEHQRAARLTSILKALSRFFWFTIEFGLIRARDGLRAYGSGLLSSYGELAHAVESPSVQRFPIQLEWAINQPFEIDRYQPLLFVVDSWDHLFSLVSQLECWMRQGRLDNVAPGSPGISEPDLLSFLH